MPELGPAFYLGAEDDKEELHIRLAAIAKHYDVTFKELTEGGLHVLPLLGKDATLLCAVTKSGRIETTNLYRQIYEAAGDIKPKNICIDTLSAGFRRQRDRPGAGLRLRDAHAGAGDGGWGIGTILSHPSLPGMASGLGYLGFDGLAWRLPLSAVPEGRQGGGRRTA